MSTSKDTKAALKAAMSYFWTHTFLDQDYIDALTGSVALRAQTTVELENNLINYLSRFDIPAYKIHDTRLFQFSTRTMDEAADRYGEGRTYGEAAFNYGTLDLDPDSPRFPVGDFIPPYLSLNILSPSKVLTLDVDYTVANGWLTFNESPLRDDAVSKIDRTDTEGSYRTFMYWGFSALEDQQDLCNFYGTIAGICGFTSEDLKRAINIAWDLRVNGASVSLLHETFALLGDVDNVHEEGVVQDIYCEGDRQCVRTDTAVYTAPAGVAVLVELGQTIYPNANIFESFQLRQGTEILDADFLPGLTLDTGFISLPSGGGLHFKNAYVPITTYLPFNWYELVRNGSDFNVLNRSGNIIDTVPESEATALIDSAPATHYKFEVGGTDEDKDDFFLKLNALDADGETFFSRLESKYGRLPTDIVPFDEIRDFYLQANSIFVKLQKQLFPEAVTGQLLNIVKAIIPAGTTFFLTKETSVIEETFTGQVEESLEVFYINDIIEEDTSDRLENLAPVGYC
jgi:hypothetical protein